MPKRLRKKSEDIDTLAKLIVEEATKETIQETPQKNPAAVELGGLGGLNGMKHFFRLILWLCILSSFALFRG